jgi:hypothetical protein
MFVLFSKYLVKLCKVWLWLNPEHRVNKNRGSINQVKEHTNTINMLIGWHTIKLGIYTVTIKISCLQSGELTNFQLQKQTLTMQSGSAQTHNAIRPRGLLLYFQDQWILLRNSHSPHHCLHRRHLFRYFLLPS